MTELELIKLSIVQDYTQHLVNNLYPITLHARRRSN